MFFLMRHGEASWQAATDFDRVLTEVGHEQLVTMAMRQHLQLKGITKIVCSPFVRTRQSAAIIAHSLGDIPIVYDNQLTPANTVQEAIAALEMHWCEQLLVVTHQPLIGNLISYFEQGDQAYPESVSPGSIYSYSMAWPGPGCGLRESVFSV
ncbi:MAG: histidine phosphatase family protein [Oceanospirillaceae bacterium]|nr:histidine phosphatase family protein [Oceanospirillaceae bacterium]